VGEEAEGHTIIFRGVDTESYDTNVNPDADYQRLMNISSRDRARPTMAFWLETLCRMVIP
jgi:hypothetical protein